MSQETRWGWVVNATSQTLYLGTAPVHIVEASGLIWSGMENKNYFAKQGSSKGFWKGNVTIMGSVGI
jgi:hypothetical protein